MVHLVKLKETANRMRASFVKWQIKFQQWGRARALSAFPDNCGAQTLRHYAWAEPEGQRSPLH